MAAATLIQPPYKSLFCAARINQRISSMHNQRLPPFISSAIADNNLHVSSTANEPKNPYNDNWFDRLAINHLSQSLQSSTGLISKKKGYDSLVEAATMASQRFDTIQQRQLVIQTLEKAIPAPILYLIKTMLPSSKFAREYFAAFTTIFFAWLVGPCQVKESEFEGRREKNVVHIPKCRFLEETKCVGMCTNLCKMPSQVFIKESLGVPIHMVPNFDDMSCEMIFGEEPPPQSLDPAFTQPCYKQCKSIKRYQHKCTT